MKTETHIFTFGRYQGHTFRFVFDRDPKYVLYCLTNHIKTIDEPSKRCLDDFFNFIAHQVSDQFRTKFGTKTIDEINQERERCVTDSFEKISKIEHKFQKYFKGDDRAGVGYYIAVIKFWNDHFDGESDEMVKKYIVHRKTDIMRHVQRSQFYSKILTGYYTKYLEAP